MKDSVINTDCPNVKDSPELTPLYDFDKNVPATWIKESVIKLFIFVLHLRGPAWLRTIRFCYSGKEVVELIRFIVASN